MKTIEQKLESLGFKNVSKENGNVNTVYQKGKRWVNISTGQTGLIDENNYTFCQSYFSPKYIQKLFAKEVICKGHIYK